MKLLCILFSLTFSCITFYYLSLSHVLNFVLSLLLMSYTFSWLRSHSLSHYHLLFYIVYQIFSTNIMKLYLQLRFLNMIIILLQNDSIINVDLQLLSIRIRHENVREYKCKTWENKMWDIKGWERIRFKIWESERE